MKYAWEGNKFSIDFEDNAAPISVEASQFPKNVMELMLKLGIRTKLRNYTAGKDVADARKAVEVGLKQLLDGNWGVDREKVELTSDEQKQVVNSYIVAAKRARGDTRDEGAILSAWESLPNDKKDAVLKANNKQIKRALAERLKAKKGKGADVGF